MACIEYMQNVTPKLLEALGFQREAHFRQNVYFWKNETEKAIWKDTYVYARLNDNK